MKKKAVIIDPYSHGAYHEVINQSYLMMISCLYDHVTYVADGSSCENLKMLMNKCGIDYSNVEFIYMKTKSYFVNLKYGSLNYFQKILIVSWLNLIWTKKYAKDVCDVFFNGNVFLALWLLIFLGGRKNNLYIMCHNEMEGIDKKENTAFVNKLFVNPFLRISFRYMNIPSRFHFILLSSFMETYFKSRISERNKKNIYSIDHAYIRPPVDCALTIDSKSNELLVGIPAAINKGRGLNILREILKKNIANSVFIQSISFITETINSPHFRSLNETGRLLPFEEYNRFVNQMHILLFLYDKGSYKLTASGAILEAIWNQKPIIALHNYYFDYVFEKFGNLGFLCDSVDELVDKINEVALDRKILNHFSDNLKKAKEALLPQNVKKQLEMIVCS
ncbi:MAG: hypothetical protein SPM09_03285 [Fibrobacter sp.]|uniref:hypothetical protein n=1 Tax=Fibrobacter sp. TaxID=35828 RepID=UPI002A919671|nr:hypothetical protein [Fibrobacter sp.]MDY6263411.1 hypothetical protein [Fibrobacter sp.]